MEFNIWWGGMVQIKDSRMTKSEMTALLGSASVSVEIITAMEQAYEMGFEHGAKASEIMKDVIDEAVSICNSIDSDVDVKTKPFWNLFDRLRGLQ
jgi:hypothetical protein